MELFEALVSTLSSVEPLPYSLPSFSVRSQGSVSQPSSLAAGCTSRCPYTSSVFLVASLSHVIQRHVSHIAHVATHVPSSPMRTGGRGSTVPSGSVWAPRSTYSMAAPRALSSSPAHLGSNVLVTEYLVVLQKGPSEDS